MKPEDSNTSSKLGLSERDQRIANKLMSKPEGSTVKGKVRGFTDYGAFVELDSGLEGMIHISDMSWTKKINHPQDVFSKGQGVEVVVLAVDAENRKINLGLKQLQENPWAQIAEKYPVNTEMEAEVVLNSNFGVFVKLEEIEPKEALAIAVGLLE